MESHGRIAAAHRRMAATREADVGSFVIATDALVGRIEIPGNLPRPLHPACERFVGRLLFLGHRLDVSDVLANSQ